MAPSGYSCPSPVTADNAVMRIVLVDDDHGMRRLLAQCLAARGFTIAGEASDGAAALELIQRTTPDAVVTDCQMPRMDGLSMVRTLRASGERCGVLMLSSQQSAAVQTAARSAGVDEYLLKPPTGPALIGLIGQVAQALRRLPENARAQVA